MIKNDITSLVQRLDAFEDRLGVRIEALSAFETIDDDEAHVAVRGELHSSNGTTIEQDIDLELSIYDTEGRVVETGSAWISSEKFFGFHTFEINCWNLGRGLAKKLRLVPKPS